jgi:[ribosomal protein S5]-alanine N-acetyltransferase
MSTTTLERIETARMICERLRDEHAAEMVRLLCDPRVAQTLWPFGRRPTEAEAIATLASKVEHWDRHGFGLWLMRDRHSGEMIGRGGLQHTFVEGVHEIEVGWAVVPERWNQGFATELALASIESGFGPLRLPQIVAFTMPGNSASRRVMEKTGFAYEREITHVGLPHVLYRRERPE